MEAKPEVADCSGAASQAPLRHRPPGSTLPDRVRSFYAYTTSSLASNLAGAAVITVTQWKVAHRPSLLAWLAAFGLVWVMRVGLARRFAVAEPADLAGWYRWWWWWNTGALLSGAMWGMAAVLLAGQENTAARTVLIIVVTALAVGAAPVLSEQPRVYKTFAALCLLPLILRIGFEGGAGNIQIAAVLTLILGLMMVLGRNYRATLDRLIELKAQTEHLAGQLRIEKAAAEAARREAETANSAKTKFFAAASHDLRQPLHALGLFAEALRQKTAGGGDETANLVNSINASVDALDGLFSELLDITKIDAGGVEPAPEHFCIGDLWRKIKLHFEPVAFEKGLALRMRGNRHFAHADPLLVERIVRNLVSNAIRYTNDGGVLVGARRRGDRLLIQVWDSGIGIGANECDHVFDEFYQVSGDAQTALAPDQRKGLGLGLAIVKRLADLMNAPLALRSQLGRGSVFELILPLGRSARAAEPLSGPLSGRGVTLEGRSVLIVEDEPSVLEGLEVLLQGWGATVKAFESAAGCAAWAASPDAARPDLLIVDYRLEAGKTGCDVIDALRARFGARVPAIVVTGSMMSSLDLQAQAHDFHVLMKPVAPNKLRAMIGFKLGAKG